LGWKHSDTGSGRNIPDTQHCFRFTVLIKAIVNISFCLQIVEIDSHIACAFSGLTADSKTLIDRARVECQNHWFTYDEKMQV
jgi:hypothetical protein